METGRVHESLQFVNSSLDIDPSMRNAWGYAGLLYQTLGECHKAIYYLGKTLDLDPEDHTSLLLSAMCLQSELDFASAFRTFDRMMGLSGARAAEANVPFHREVAFYRMSYLDTPLLEFNYDMVVDKSIKVGLNKREPFPFPVDRGNSVEKIAREKATAEALIKHSQPVRQLVSDKARAALKVSSQLRGWIQLDSPGFLPHRRQHRMFGLAVLDMAQQLSEYVRARKAGLPGLWVSDARSSVLRERKGGMVRPTDVKKKGHHLFSYRDFFDTAVKWRQLADAFDVVFWLDGYPLQSQMELVALSTSLYSGLKKNTRYYPYFNMTYELFRREMKDKYFAGPEPTFTLPDQQAGIESANTLEDLFNVSRVAHIMFVVTECESLVSPGKKLPGTRVVITKIPPEGFDISIGSPTEEGRFELFSAEVDAAFNKIMNALVNDADVDTIVDLALDLYFYWANWGPLSRGTAATGYAAIISIMLAVGEHVTSKIPNSKQMDWEAILRTSPSEFRAAVRPWLAGRERTAIPAEWLDGAPGYKLSGDIFVTPRDVMSTLSAPDEDY
jgi:tetratricopeptide (TPR) repeat protein